MRDPRHLMPSDPGPGHRTAAPVPADPRDPAAVFAAHRDILAGVAYRILGQVADAEDVVQDAWLRWSGVDGGDVRDPRAFLVRVTTRLAIDRLRRRKARREEYVGAWLPEPIPTGGSSGDVSDQVVLAESVSMALLVVLETMSPLERAVFVLHEGFGFSHAEIAEAVDRSETAVRQLARRARDHVREGRPRFDPDPVTHRHVTQRFLAATVSGDLAALMQVLAPGVELIADGGGQVRAPLLPVRGVERVTRFLIAVAGRATPDQHASLVDLNGRAAIVVWSGSTVAAVLAVDVVDGRIERIYLVANPAKLALLRPPSS